ncbi:MAG: DUF721 domain-containing protein [Planctomycetota bacterium]|nr:DUF721 domain-containing protein [Planctomycetota bacterium]MDA1210959.1 DUF721 domain-containing protein [Planctomycetota bacterium]
MKRKKEIKKKPRTAKPPSLKSEPTHFSHALSQLILMKGLARSRSESQVQDVWMKVCDPECASQSRAMGIRNNVLHVGVSNAALLSELVAFHREHLLDELRRQAPQLKIKDIKFKVKGDLLHPKGTSET